MKESFANAPVTTEELVSVLTMLTIEIVSETCPERYEETLEKIANDLHETSTKLDKQDRVRQLLFSLATHLMATE
jgi:hypothetical protein